MSDDARFAEGFIVGWRSIMGPDGPAAAIPPYSDPPRRTDYLHGITKGLEAAQKQKAEQEDETSKNSRTTAEGLGRDKH